METWKSINGYEGIYEVSNRGNVRSLDRHVPRVTNKAIKNLKGTYFSKGKPISQTDNGNGYKIACLSNNGRKNHYIHRLVAEAFLDKRNYNEVNHIDGDKSNNKVENLEWCSRSSNLKHAILNGLKTKVGANSNNAIKVVDIKTGRVYGTIKEASVHFGVKYGLLKEALRRSSTPKHPVYKRLKILHDNG